MNKDAAHMPPPRITFSCNAKSEGSVFRFGNHILVMQQAQTYGGGDALGRRSRDDRLATALHGATHSGDQEAGSAVLEHFHKLFRKIRWRKINAVRLECFFLTICHSPFFRDGLTRNTTIASQNENVGCFRCR